MALERSSRGAWPRTGRWSARQRTYWTTVYKRTWKGSVVTSFVMPLLYVLAMGVLLGGFVSTGADLEGAPTYLAFVAPGLVAAQAMQTATGETTWPVMGSIKWHRTYYAMVATPLAVADVVAAQLVFVMFRLATVAGVFLLVMAPFGVFESAAGRAAGVAGAGAGRAELRGRVLRLLRDHQERVGVRDHLPAAGDPAVPVLRRVLPDQQPVRRPLEWLARLTPLWHGVDLTRMLVLGQVRPGLALVHLAYLVVLSLVGWWLAVWRLDKRMEV